MERDHVEFMEAAIQVAKNARLVDEVPIGCVFVHVPTGEILASAHNRTCIEKNGTRHAEMVAIDDILTKYSYEVFRDCVLYVTVEPCIMCAAALREIQINKVYFGAWNEKFGGCGGVLTVHQDEWDGKGGRYEAVGDLLRKESIMLLREFYLTENHKAPNPQKKDRRVLKFDIPPPKQ
ncbi:hypothetical protein MP638_004529 [Amoeboaphelidium occidentale]|nr:hypothetical protein MP638_004529 [Amoeboaphelidium occidentale]